MLASASRVKSKSALSTHAKSAHKRNKPSSSSLQSDSRHTAHLSKSSSKIKIKQISGSTQGSPRAAVDVSFANENRFPTTGADEGIDSIKNASLYDLIKIQMDQHVKQTKLNKKSKEKLTTPKPSTLGTRAEVDESNLAAKRLGKTRNSASKSPGVSTS